MVLYTVCTLSQELPALPFSLPLSLSLTHTHTHTHTYTLLLSINIISVSLSISHIRTHKNKCADTHSMVLLWCHTQCMTIFQHMAQAKEILYMDKQKDREQMRQKERDRQTERKRKRKNKEWESLAADNRRNPYVSPLQRGSTAVCDYITANWLNTHKHTCTHTRAHMLTKTSSTPLRRGSNLFSSISRASVPSSIRSSLVITPIVRWPKRKMKNRGNFIAYKCDFKPCGTMKNIWQPLQTFRHKHFHFNNVIINPHKDIRV